MFKVAQKYEDFNGNQQVEDLYFNLSKSEIVTLEMDENTSLSARWKKIGQSSDAKAAYAEIRNLILMAFGRKSEDGRKFEKSDEISKDFEQSAAYDEFVWDMFKDQKKIINFMNNLVPKKAIQEALESEEGRKYMLENPEEAKEFKQYLDTKDKPAETPKGTFGQDIESTVEQKRPTPPGMTAEQFSEWLKQNPDAIK